MIKIASTLYNIAQCHMLFVPNTKQKKKLQSLLGPKSQATQNAVGYRQNGP